MSEPKENAVGKVEYWKPEIYSPARARRQCERCGNVLYLLPDQAHCSECKTAVNFKIVNAQLTAANKRIEELEKIVKEAARLSSSRSDMKPEHQMKVLRDKAKSHLGERSERRMKTVEISDSHFNKLEWLRHNWYCVKGQQPRETTSSLMERLIDDEMSKASPPVYQTTGFDRQ